MTYIPLGERPEWADVTPIPQADAPNALVPIMYTQEYKDASDYFRAVVASGEKSPRVLDLTRTLLSLNAAHYTVWQYRFQTVLALGDDAVAAELKFLDEYAVQNLKSYQVWHHRLSLISHASPADPRPEIEFVHATFIPEPKNYHTWTYIHWLYSHFSDLGRISPQQWDDELDWCEGLIAADGRNNSAWGWRWFLRVARPGAVGLENDGREEIEYALTEIHRIPHNASAWNYLRGIIRAVNAPRDTILPALTPYLAGAAVPVPAAKLDLGYPTREGPLSVDTPLPVPLALEFLADTLAEGGQLADASAVFGQLASEVDRMRAAYWEHRRSQCVNA
ncbi:Protein farnesyltransferase/geranylgeranyltransferase type-1 subunit alpha [Vanrija pseudolonga]|uniref:Protein farnesyltransferase/geranylgeranyltransferase type-1 subunit alpha n=1 Tax=Vanrija pseudolonga TaxID=143232 RepID=A0AAF1BKZ8_9TREE|nr:Protein farnesyltransferase/geranylgeranyltransferase type-1 subunit alpha [Vanrija pseudolonga]